LGSFLNYDSSDYTRPKLFVFFTAFSPLITTHTHSQHREL
jgi:hypothetical protein